MGFGKAFGFSLLAYIGLSFLFIVITETLSGNLNPLFNDISSNPLIIFLIFFGNTVQLPSTVFISIYGQITIGAIDYNLIRSIGYIVTPLVAALVAGRVGENKAGSFGGFFLTSVIGSIILGILAYLSTALMVYSGFLIIDPVFLGYFGISVIDPTTTLIILVLAGAVNGIFYGAFSLMFTKTEYY
ncbi:MAG: hypothetical protein ACFFKA_07530 [Candidatus Thorarchaeota archaeon]